MKWTSYFLVYGKHEVKYILEGEKRREKTYCVDKEELEERGRGVSVVDPSFVCEDSVAILGGSIQMQGCP